MKEKDTQVQNTREVPNKVVSNNMKPKRPTPRHIITKMPKVKDKEKVLKVTRERELPVRKIS